MSLEQEYVDLTERLAKLQQRQAVLVAQEEQKAEERTRLEKELQEAGVDVGNLDSEIVRLDQEISKAFLESKSRVDDFEVALKRALAGESPVEVAKPKIITEPLGGSADIDLI